METRDMKVKEQKSKAVKVEVVREAVSIDALLKTTEAGYIHADAKIQDVPTADLVRYAVTKLEAGQSALRLAVLFTGAVFKTCTSEKAGLYADGLTTSWGSMSKDILSIGRALPQLESTGLALANVRDLYGLREVRKILLGDDKAQTKKAVALLNEGKAPRKVREAVIGSPKADPEPKAETAPEPAVDKSAIAETQLLVAAERVAASIDHDERVKLALQVVAKLKLAGYALQKVK